MKLTVEQRLDCAETEIHIVCGMMDAKLKKLLETVRLYSFSVMGVQDGVERPVPLEEIFYFDSADNKTFLYLKNEVLSCSQKLYELETLLADTAFVRISKNCIVNTMAVSHVQAQFSGRLLARLQNGESVVVSKHYARAFREKFRQQ